MRREFLYIDIFFLISYLSSCFRNSFVLLCESARKDDTTCTNSLTVTENDGEDVEEVSVQSTTTENVKDSCSQELENVLQSRVVMKTWCVPQPPSADVLWLDEDSAQPDESQGTLERSPSLLGSIGTCTGVATTSTASDEVCTPLLHQKSASDEVCTPLLHQKSVSDDVCTPLLHQKCDSPGLAKTAGHGGTSVESASTLSCTGVDIPGAIPMGRPLRSCRALMTKPKDHAADTSFVNNPDEICRRPLIQKKGMSFVY